ncbi:MAG: DUF559 domain-containing protein [Candidatus Borkfalkiaceae bacterium]|nr:DUF559 domain-containing protein [Christensenellaceae bacterium]
MYEFNNPSLKKISQKLRRSMTDEERKLWYGCLSTFPVKFRRQKVMPDKINTNLAKTPLFPRFLAKSRLKYGKYVCTRLYQKSSKISAFWLRASPAADF